MELMEKYGFKQTEVGRIPEDWELVSFDDVFTFYSTSSYSKAQMSEYDEIGCIHYGLIHAIPNSQYNLRDGIKYYVSKNQAKYEFVKDGDVIMVDASEDLEGVNKSVEVFGIGNQKYISGLHTYLLRDKNLKLADNFRGILLNSKKVKNQMLQLAVGMKVFGVSKTQLVNVLLPLPTLEEQKAIATALSDVDELIINLDKLIAKKKALKQGVMQQLLTPPHKGGKRLEGFTGDWEEIKLGEIADFYKGKGLPKSDIVEGGRYKCIHYGELFTKYNQIITNVKSRTNQNSNVFLSKKNDVLMPTSDVTPNGLATASVIFENDIILGGDVLVIRPHKNLYGGFLSYQVSINKQQIMSLITGTTVFHLYGSDMAKFSFYFPDFEEQKAIVDIINDMDIEIEKLETKKTKYQSVKQGMMQELLTGKTRLI